MRISTSLRKQILIHQYEFILPVTFTTDAYADITMLGDIALKMLKMMGHSATVPGAILAEDVPTALDLLKTAINSGELLPQAQGSDEDEQDISMIHRGFL